MMVLGARYFSHKLNFKFDAGTSRGVLRHKTTYILELFDPQRSSVVARGEAGPLKGLSPDDHADFETWLKQLCQTLEGMEAPENSKDLDRFLDLIPLDRPALRFCLESALLNWLHGDDIYFSSSFLKGAPIPINGLIWMGDMDFMKSQIDRKMAQGYRCLKMKIGALDFDQECQVLSYIRKVYGNKLILRVDANGAFSADSAQTKLERLATFNLHSIEQPIAAGQPAIMAKLCAESPIPIALDEELIGIVDGTLKKQLLQEVRPQFIIIKPTLLGGFSASDEWISLAKQLGIGWWITSALESNIGLNAIAQYAASLNCQGHQGLGTGQLYDNNFESRLTISEGQLRLALTSQ